MHTTGSLLVEVQGRAGADQLLGQALVDAGLRAWPPGGLVEVELRDETTYDGCATSSSTSASGWSGCRSATTASRTSSARGGRQCPARLRSASGRRRPAVIHDIGYRPYTGPRLGERAVAWAFFLTGVRNCFGLGRSGRSKIMPMTLLGLMLLPALILVGVLVQARDLLGLDEQHRADSVYPVTTQLLISVFVAAQAPALISRDLRFRTITLYLARPSRRTTYVLVRLASLTVATFILIALTAAAAVRRRAARRPPARPRDRPLPRRRWSGRRCWRPAWPGWRALVSALTIRRGLAVAAVIVVLLVSYTVVATIQGISFETEQRTVGEMAGLFSPYTLVNGVQVFLFDSPRPPPTPRPAAATGAALPGAHRRDGAGSTAAAAPLPEGAGVSTLQLDRVSRWYGNVVAVNDVTMTIGPGVTGLLGPNGAGKSTLIALMSGFLAPSAGTAPSTGSRCGATSRSTARSGSCPSGRRCSTTSPDGSSSWPTPSCTGCRTPGAAAARSIALVEMGDAQDRMIATYSKGMRQRIKMASSLVHDPAVLLLDEPFNGMDPRQRIHLMELLRAHGRRGPHRAVQLPHPRGGRAGGPADRGRRRRPARRLR